MTLSDIKKIITLNGGATLTHKGEIATLQRGYMVSLADCETVTTLQQLDERQFKHYLKLARKKKAYFGLWLDSSALYLDISIHVGQKVAARNIGKRNNQLAIFDLENNTSIYLNK